MNKILFKRILKAKKTKLQALATALGISRQSISNKIGEKKSEFTNSEIKTIKTLLGLTDEELIEIFFED